MAGLGHAETGRFLSVSNFTPSKVDFIFKKPVFSILFRKDFFRPVAQHGRFAQPWSSAKFISPCLPFLASSSAFACGLASLGHFRGREDLLFPASSVSEIFPGRWVGADVLLLAGSPFRVPVKDVVDPGKVKCSGPGLGAGVRARVPQTFTVDCSQAGRAPLHVAVLGPTGTECLGQGRRGGGRTGCQEALLSPPPFPRCG